jgi:predicted transcriptional regulator
MDVTQPTVKQLLTQLMIKRGLTQVQTADLLSTSQANISRWLKTDLKETSMFSRLLRQTLTTLINMK